MTNLFNLLKATLLCILLSLTFVTIFSLFVGWFLLDIFIIKIINQVFKIICIAVGGVVFIKGERGFIQGIIYGIVAIISTYFLYSLMAGSLYFSPLFFVELLLGATAGAISGIIGVNIKNF